MRTSYGQATRKFFLEHTNPLILIDFPGIKVFETATVDVNILLYVKEKPTFNTWGCTIKDNKLKKLSLYVRQHGEKITFSPDENWVILSEIEQRIKAKIEAIGTPLKEWNVNIYRGILTGYNDAFIIDKAKKEEILAKCQSEEERKKTDELIRPYNLGTFRILSNKFSTLLSINDKSIIEACFYSIVYGYIPLLEWRPYGFYFCLDTLFYLG